MPFSPAVIYVRKTISLFFEYDTPRYVHINSKKIGVFSRVVQLILIGYIIGFVLVFKKGYQDSCPVESTIVTKVKGVTFTNFTDHELNVTRNPELYRRIWDQSDYVFPASGNEHGGLFVMTSVVITPNQTRRLCPEDPKIVEAICNSTKDCEFQRALEVGNGIQSGKCIPSRRKPEIKTCEIYAWCPVEEDIPPLNGTQPLLADAVNFTILIKNAISFPMFGSQYQRRNILESSNFSYLQACTYHRHSDPFCPVFRLGDIISEAGENFTEVASKGAIFRITINWNCDLDFNFLDYCRPEYNFQRMDNPNVLIAPGWNFRSAQYHEENRRTLFKMYGIKFLIEVDGQARKFSIVPLLLNVGSGLALMGLVSHPRNDFDKHLALVLQVGLGIILIRPLFVKATVVCDLLVLYCLKKRGVYKEKKFLSVRGDDAFDVNPSQRYGRLSVDQGSENAEDTS